jgi:meiotic recombination protein DMC1
MSRAAVAPEGGDGTAEEELGAEMPAEFEEIDKLTELAISATDLKKLKDAGYFTVSSILMNTLKSLCAVKGLSEPKVLKIREAALKLVGAGFITGNEARIRREKIINITTGSPALDAILGGGIETGSITEAFGEFRCGKTQISHTLCVSAQLPTENGGGNGRVAFIDTENTFRPERIVEIATRFELDADDVLDNILVARAYTSEHQSELLDHVAARMAQDRFALLIVDSATALFRVDFAGRGELADRQQKLGKFMSSLTKIAEQFGVAVWITNQVMAVPDAMAFQPNKPIGGHILAHASTTRLSIRKGRGEQRICKLFDSPLYAEAEATFQIDSGGISDPTD